MKAHRDDGDLLLVFAQTEVAQGQRHRATTPSDAHPWDTGGRGPVGSSKAGKAVLRCPHCQVTFYERPTCPSCGKTPAL